MDESQISKRHREETKETPGITLTDIKLSTTPPRVETAIVVQDSGPSASDKLRDLTDTALSFLSTASNETLGACLAGLFAATYLILGRVGLLLIGLAGGVVLHATWEGSNGTTSSGPFVGGDRSRRKKELGVEVANRILGWREINNGSNNDGEAILEKNEASIAGKLLDYSAFKPATGAALTVLTDAIIRDYVKWWYTPILPSEVSFPQSCRQTLTSFILSFSNHISRKRPADPFLDFVANSTSIIIVFLNELSTALKASQKQAPAEAVRAYLQHEPESNLANVLSTQQQERKLVLVAEDVLQNFLDPNAYDCPPVKAFLRQIMAGLIFEMTIRSCSKPEWINGWIVYLLEDGEPEIMNVIDAGMESMGGTVKDSSTKPSVEAENSIGHNRRVSKAEEAMQEAMLEAKRMNDMIAEENARRRQELTIAENEDALSTATTEGIATPTSSDSDRNRISERSLDSSMVIDQSNDEAVSQPATPSRPATSAYFDQVGLCGEPISNLHTPVMEAHPPTPLTLHNASITIFDDGDLNDKSILRAMPVTEYLLQIEPASSRFPGWMIGRKYADFESLHEVLRRISIISGVSEFVQTHGTLPTWRGQTRPYLTRNLERYLQHALRYKPLAESEAVKRFLEKEAGLEKAGGGSNRNVLSFQSPAALETMGKGFINVLGQAPKGLAGGGKAVLGSVQGVFGAVATGVGGPKKASLEVARFTPKSSNTTLPPLDTYTARPSKENLGHANKAPPLPSRPQQNSSLDSHSVDTRSPSHSRDDQSPGVPQLPPRPSDIADDYEEVPDPPPELPPRAAVSSPASPLAAPGERALPRSDPGPGGTDQLEKKGSPLTEEETRVTIELLFAIINELYSLSSAWTIRLSLLSAAKTFLLRPNNPQLESIRSLLQDTIIDSNFNDSGLASHILKVRENALPTEEELKKWPGEMSAAEKERLRVKARKLLVERGMPQALTSVMGAAASGEALGRVFDCLQVEEVARGLIFALLLQALRAATQ